MSQREVINNPFRTMGVYIYIYIYWIFQPNILQKLETKHVMRDINQRYRGDITKPNIRFGYVCCFSLLIQICEYVNGKIIVNINFDYTIYLVI